MLIATVYDSIKGNKKVTFYQLQMIEILRQRYDIQYGCFNDRMTFVLNENGDFKEIRLSGIRKLFADIIRNEFESLVIEGEIEYMDFINEYHKLQPIKIYSAREEFAAKMQ